MTKNESSFLPMRIGKRAGLPAEFTSRGAVTPSGGAPAPLSEWQRYVVAAMRHKWFVLMATLLGTALGVFASRYLDPRYTARAILWIETANDKDRGSNRGPDVGISSEDLLESEGWVDLVTSNAVLDSVVRGMRLYLNWKHPADSSLFSAFRLTGAVRSGRYRWTVDRAGRAFALARGDSVVERGSIATGSVPRVGTTSGFDWPVPPAACVPGRTVEFDLATPYDAAQGLMTDMKVRSDPGVSFLRLQLKGTDPVLTAATLNAVADRIVTVASELKREKFQELAAILRDQYDHAQSNLRIAEGSLSAFRVRTAGSGGWVVTPSLDPRDPALTGSLQLRTELDQVRRDRQAIRRALTAPSGAGAESADSASIEALAAIPAVLASPELTVALDEFTKREAALRAWRYRYTPQSAPVREEAGNLETLERQVIPSLVRRLDTQLAQREATLAARSDSAVGDLRRIPTLALQDARLAQDVANAQQVFTNVRDRFEATQLALVSSLSDVRILDRAEAPQRPSLSFAPLVIALAGTMCFGLSVLGATVFDDLDRKVRYPEHVTNGMRLSFLGAIPYAGRTPEQEGDRADQVIESLRSLRLRVLHAHGGPGPLLLTVTSPGSAEGKSFVSVNLALAFAGAGYPTLLVDGDVRRGAQHRVLKASRTPGLTDVLAETTALEEAIQKTSYSSLWFLSSGTRLRRSPELLLSQRMRDLMEQLRTQYTVVIVDSPPLAAGVDPMVLAAATGSLLLVLRAGTSDARMATSKLEAFEDLPVRTLGAVLNAVRPTGAYRYYTYGLDGYGTPEDEVVEEPRVLEGRS